MSVPAKSIRLDKKRISELRKWLVRGKESMEDMPYGGLEATEYIELIAILDDYERCRDYERKWNELVETTGQRIAQAGGQDGKS